MVFRQNDIKTYGLKNILLRQRNIGTRILITKEQKQGKALLHLRRAFLPIQESLSLHQRNTPFVCKQWFSLPSPFGEGLGVRLFFI